MVIGHSTVLGSYVGRWWILHVYALLSWQLAMYKDRYEEFQATITKSNDMFQKLKSEMDKVWVSFLIGQ